MAIQAPVGSIWYTDPNQTIGTYPFINVTQSESGHFLMMDDTPQKELIRLQHGKTGTYFEMQPDGSYQQVIYGNSFQVIVNDQNVVVQGICNVEVHGDSKVHVYGDSNMQIDGSLVANVGKASNIHVEGDLDVTAAGEVRISAGGSDITNPIGHDITLITGGTVNIKGDLNVSGKVVAGPISSTGGIVAAYKVFGTGGLETLGGVNIGFSTPGPIVPPGVMTATISASAPLTTSAVHQGGVVSDMFGPTAIMRLFDAIHNHIAPSSGGPTTPAPQHAYG
jgi:hypothetical protein